MIQVATLGKLDVIVRRFEILEYDKKTDRYERTMILDPDEVIKYDYTEEDYPNNDSLNFEVKNKERFRKFVPQSKAEFSTMKPMIIAQYVGSHLMWFSFIIGREMVITSEGQYINFTGVGFTYFHKQKLLNSNTNFTQTGEVNDLPEDFGFYVGTGTINQHMKYMYDTYLNPKEITYGVLSTKAAPYRKFKGLSRVRCMSENTQVSKIRMEQNYLNEFVDRVYETFNLDLQFRQRLVNGKIELTLSDPTYVNSEVIRKQTDILEEVQEQTTDINLVYGYAWGNNYTTQYADEPAYFTTVEHREDLAYIGKQNNEYIINTSKTLLRRYQMNLVRHIIKINSDQFFFNIFTGCIIRYKGTPYRVTTIKETNSREEGIAFDVEIKEVEEDV